jgi:hypothetical protein
VVQGPQGSTKITRPSITEAIQMWMALTNIRALLCAVHPMDFAVQTLLSVESMCTKAVGREHDGGIRRDHRYIEQRGQARLRPAAA